MQTTLMDKRVSGVFFDFDRLKLLRYNLLHKDDNGNIGFGLRKSRLASFDQDDI